MTQSQKTFLKRRKFGFNPNEQYFQTVFHAKFFQDKIKIQSAFNDEKNEMSNVYYFDVIWFIFRS